MGLLGWTSPVPFYLSLSLAECACGRVDLPLHAERTGLVAPGKRAVDPGTRHQSSDIEPEDRRKVPWHFSRWLHGVTGSSASWGKASFFVSVRPDPRGTWSHRKVEKTRPQAKKQETKSVTAKPPVTGKPPLGASGLPLGFEVKPILGQPLRESQPAQRGSSGREVDR